jgi:5-(carboxyamino)imidazole ribonucleotide synthase
MGPAAMSAGGPVRPGSTIGILGGGQLGRMLALAAAQLGYRAHVFVPEADSPAARWPRRHRRRL